MDNIIFSEANQTWKQIIENPDIIAIYRHGSTAKGKESDNDIDILLVLKHLEFTNWCSENLLGFEHIRHKSFIVLNTKEGKPKELAFDIYLTDKKHYALAFEILGISENNCLFKREELTITKENLEAIDFSKAFAQQINKAELEEMLPKAISEKLRLREEAYRKLREWKTEIFEKNWYFLIVEFWLFKAYHSWFNTFRDRERWNSYDEWKREFERIYKE